MYADFNNKVSPYPSYQLHHHFWQGMRTIKVVKCPPNFSPQRNRNPKLNPNTNSYYVHKSGISFDLAGHFVMFILSMHLITDTSGHRGKMKSFSGLPFPRWSNPIDEYHLSSPNTWCFPIHCRFSLLLDFFPQPLSKETRWLFQQHTVLFCQF